MPTYFLVKRLLSLPQKHLLLVLAVAVGFMAGMVAVILKNLVYLIGELLTWGFVNDYFNVLYVAYPLIGLVLTVYVVKRIIRKEPGSGISSVLYAISRRRSTLKRHNIYSALLTSFITVGFGGSAGLESPTVQTTAAMGSNLGAALHLNQRMRTILIACAAAGSMASMFQAPVAAIVFAVEVLMIDLTTATIVPILLASISALVTSHFFLSEDVLFHIKQTDLFSFAHIHFYILLGIFTGVFSIYFNRIFLTGKRWLMKFRIAYRKALLGGLFLGIIIFFLPPLYGEGYEVINRLMEDDLSAVAERSVFYEYRNNEYIMLLFVAALLTMKVFATTITLGSGGVGGVFAPSLFVGASLGYFFTRLCRTFDLANLPVAGFTLVGMAGLLAGVLHAPLTSIFLIAEITGGYELFVPLMITAAISYYTSRLFSPHTIYTEELAERGELITHDKDRAVLTLMNIQDQIDTDFLVLRPEQTLGELIKAVSSSNRNVFPVVDPKGNLFGVITLDSIRQIMFDQSQYDQIRVNTLMSPPPETVYFRERVDQVMNKFDQTGAWYLPVLDNSRYLGFVSKSRLLAAYRKKLMEHSGENE